MAKADVILGEVGGGTFVIARVGGKTGLRYFADRASMTGPEPGFIGSHLAVRHAASVKARDVYIARALVAADPPFPTVEKLARGEQSFTATPAASHAVWLARPGELGPWKGPRIVYQDAGRLYQYVLVGTKPKNYRFVAFSSPFTTPPPS